MAKKFLCVIALVLTFVCTFISCDNDENSDNSQSSAYEAKYNEACTLIENGNYEDAYKALCEIKDYTPAKEKLNNFFFAPTLIKEGFLVSVSGSSLGPAMKYEDMVYSYDANGNITSITRSQHNITYNYIYDSKGNELAGYPVDSPASSKGARTCSYKNGKLSKISYSDYTDEYFYNADGTLSKIVHTYQPDYYDTPSVYETVYTYTYHDNKTVKTMRYSIRYEGYEYQYNTDGTITKICIYDDSFSEYYGYFSISYGDYGVDKAECWTVDEDSGLESLRGEITYTYDKDGRLIEVMTYYKDELQYVFLLSDYKLCYSENENAKHRISTISKTSIESMLDFYS